MLGKVPASLSAIEEKIEPLSMMSPLNNKTPRSNGMQSEPAWCTGAIQHEQLLPDQMTVWSDHQ
jgi:hypothetical protein